MLPIEIFCEIDDFSKQFEKQFKNVFSLTEKIYETAYS
jgi:hypothetical protein